MYPVLMCLGLNIGMYYFNTCMTVITVRIDDELKRLMDKIGINWSEFIRNASREKLREI